MMMKAVAVVLAVAVVNGAPVAKTSEVLAAASSYDEHAVTLVSRIGPFCDRSDPNAKTGTCAAFKTSAGSSMGCWQPANYGDYPTGPPMSCETNADCVICAWDGRTGATDACKCKGDLGSREVCLKKKEKGKCDKAHIMEKCALTCSEEIITIPPDVEDPINLVSDSGPFCDTAPPAAPNYGPDGELLPADPTAYCKAFITNEGNGLGCWEPANYQGYPTGPPKSCTK